MHSSSPIQEMLSKPGADPVLSFRSKMLLEAELTSTCNRGTMDESIVPFSVLPWFGSEQTKTHLLPGAV